MAETEVAEQAPEYSEKIKEVLDKISGFTLLELSELVKAFETEFGIQAAVAAPVAVAASAEAEEEFEPSSYKVVLKNFGEKKIQVIKAVRAETPLALKEAKQVVESAPSTIKDGISNEEAQKCAKTLQEAGAEVEVQPETD